MQTHALDPNVVTGPLYLAAIAWEAWGLRRRRRHGDRRALGYERRDAWASVLAGATALVAWIPWQVATGAAAWWCWQYRLCDLGTGAVGWLVALVGWDFSFYWQHRMEHEVRFLWGGHVTHHSSRYFNFSTALRQSWTPWTGFFFYSPWALLGVHPVLLYLSGGLNLLYQFFLHTETVGRLPAGLEAWLNTPSHHRVHHGTNPQYIDRNYAGVLIVWDRLFGTFEPERERVVYGLTKNITSYNPFWIQLHEYVGMARDASRAATWRDRLGYVFGMPGWTPSA